MLIGVDTTLPGPLVRAKNRSRPGRRQVRLFNLNQDLKYADFALWVRRRGGTYVIMVQDIFPRKNLGKS